MMTMALQLAKMPPRQAVSCLYTGDWIWLTDRARVKQHSPPAPVNYLISKCPKQGLGLQKSNFTRILFRGELTRII